jgi:hypothetical protein
LAGTGSVSEELGVTGVALVDLSSGLVEDLGRLTVVQIVVLKTTSIDFGTGGTILREGELLAAGHALGLGTESTFSMDVSTLLALHSVLVLSG